MRRSYLEGLPALDWPPPAPLISRLIRSYAYYHDQFGVAVMLPNEDIVAPPNAESCFMRIASDNTITEYPLPSAGGERWFGGVLAPNGNIYVGPKMANTILVIKPDMTTYQIPGLPSGSWKWEKGVLAPNGKIYYGPMGSSSGNKVLVIDPADDSFYFFDSPPVNLYTGFHRAVLAPNGKIYAAGMNKIACIDPVHDTATVIADLNYTVSNMLLSLDGYIYIVQEDKKILRFDPETNLVTTVFTSSFSYQIVCLRQGVNGYLYGFCNGTPFSVYVLHPVTFEAVHYLTNWGEATQAHQGILRSDGVIVGIPSYYNNIPLVDTGTPVPAAYFVMPSDLNDLPGSMYNIFCN